MEFGQKKFVKLIHLTSQVFWPGLFQIFWSTVTVWQSKFLYIYKDFALHPGGNYSHLCHKNNKNYIFFFNFKVLKCLNEMDKLLLLLAKKNR